MALKATIFRAVNIAKAAIQDLGVDALLIKRCQDAYIPGSSPTFSELTYPVKMVMTAYDAKEIDGDRIQASDFQAIVLPAADITQVPEPNDVIRIELLDYRVVMNSKVMAGDSVALSQLQLRLR